MSPYRVAVTGDQAQPDGATIFGDIGLSRLEAAGMEWEVVPVPDQILTSGQLDGFDALLMMGGRGIDAGSLTGGRLRHIARFGAGYDAIDIAACTRAGVMVTNTAEAVRTPMAHAAAAFVFALAHNLVVKDRLVRDGRWDERVQWQGRGLEGARIGILGLGGVGTETARLFRALGLTVGAYNRSPRPDAAALGIRMMPLHELAAWSDYLIITISANEDTAGLFGAPELALMRSDAFLVNLSRGAVIDEAALVAALDARQIRGAALDVFAHEPLEAASPLRQMDHAILAPHSLCWTDGFARAVADSAITALIDVAHGRFPRSPVNPEVLPEGARAS